MESDESKKIFGMLKASSMGRTTTLRNLVKNYSSEFGKLSDDFAQLGYLLNDNNLMYFLQTHGSVEITKQGRDYYVSFEVAEEEKQLREMIGRDISKSGKKNSKNRRNSFVCANNEFRLDLHDFEQKMDSETTALIQSRASSYYEKLKQKKESQQKVVSEQREIILNSNDNDNDNVNCEKKELNKEYKDIDGYSGSLSLSSNGKISNNTDEKISNNGKFHNLDSSNNLNLKNAFNAFGETSITNLIVHYNKTPKLRKEFRKLVSNSSSVVNVMEKMLQTWEQQQK